MLPKPVSLSDRSSLNQIESSGARAWQLQFLNKLPSTLFTGGRIESEDGEPLQIAIVDASNSLKPVSLSDSEGAPAAAAEESSEVSDATAVKSSEAPTDADEGVSGAAPAANEGSSENTEEEKSGDEEAAEETPEIKVVQILTAKNSKKVDTKNMNEEEMAEHEKSVAK
ncbi:hypothetical protein RJ640_005410 [Escallonia rubra]|uniref:Calmodulin binding protein-like N-terminal domain-containing protein n=1 Tax=Escallonia rubra TaxID=112253 RepID=A0AA88UQF3_9ASTE|nr:hypothetical protein RJ640_005410 [Escallonia rubra]